MMIRDRTLIALIALAACTDEIEPVPVDNSYIWDGVVVPYGSVGLDDVSILYPYGPTTADWLRLTTVGNGGPLLDEWVFATIEREIPIGRAYHDYVIVSARIDPCFPNLDLIDSNPTKCRRQLRLVAIPVSDFGVGDFSLFGDSAIHLLFDLTKREFFDLAAAWRALRTPESSDPSRALGPHPTFAGSTLHDPFARAVAESIMRFAGPATLREVAITESVGDDVVGVWRFGSFRIDGDKVIAKPIIGATQVTTIDTRVASDGRFVDTEPRTAISRVVTTFGTTPSKQPVEPVIDVLDPQLHDADSVDCSSCHLAGTLLVNERARLPYALEPYNLAHQSPSPGNTFNQRAFAYRSDQPVWSQRTIYESARVAATLSNSGPWW